MKNKRPVFAFTLIELLVVMSIIALLLSILMPALGRARKEAMLVKDSARIRSIHSGWLTWATGHQGRYPTPGYVNRLALDNGQEVRGRGAEDRLANTSDNVHSLAVMENLYNADRLLSENEPSGNVFAMEHYDYTARNPSEDTYWDEELNVDLDDGGDGCHVSYSSIPLIGSRKEKEWASTGSSEFAILSNRGTRFGQYPDYSVTYDIHGSGRTWVGNVCWQDNHMTYEETFQPSMSVYRTSEGHVSDNLFNIDCVTGVCNFWGGDTWLVLVSELTEAGDMFPYQLMPELEWDDPE
ncbi:MAG: type II secretion system protein [Phycisphaerales bacterium]|nr:type II secretion system protein [Phycisphaerales bacterium]